jgi:hypothetical protein
MRASISHRATSFDGRDISLFDEGITKNIGMYDVFLQVSPVFFRVSFGLQVSPKSAVC